MRKRAIAATMLLTAAMAFTSCAKLYEDCLLYTSPIGSRCTFKGIGGKTVAVWWSNFIGHYPRKELSRKPEYSFIAWENCNVVPEFQTY